MDRCCSLPSWLLSPVQPCPRERECVWCRGPHLVRTEEFDLIIEADDVEAIRRPEHTQCRLERPDGFVPRTPRHTSTLVQDEDHRTMEASETTLLLRFTRRCEEEDEVPTLLLRLRIHGRGLVEKDPADVFVAHDVTQIEILWTASSCVPRRVSQIRTENKQIKKKPKKR